MQPHLTFVQITDSHLGPARDYSYFGHFPYRTLTRAIDLINAMPQLPDFVVHTGDVSNDCSAESYALAAELLGRLRVPLYLLSGNHDDRALLRKVLDAPPAPDGDPDAPLDYAFEVKGERFLALDGRTPEVRDPLGKLSAAQLARVRAEAEADGPQLTVLLHYPPFPMGSPWLDENMPLVNGEELQAALLPAQHRLRGVFCGHLHHLFLRAEHGSRLHLASLGGEAVARPGLPARLQRGALLRRAGRRPPVHFLASSPASLRSASPLNIVEGGLRLDALPFLRLGWGKGPGDRGLPVTA